jgi:hypothetical protein
LKPVGRPIKGKEARSVRIDVRLTPEEARVLEALCLELDLSKAEVIRRGLEIQERMVTYDY